MKTGMKLAGSRIDFNQGAPLAGLITPCVVVWDHAGLIYPALLQDNYTHKNFNWKGTLASGGVLFSQSPPPPFFPLVLSGKPA